MSKIIYKIRVFDSDDQEEDTFFKSSLYFDKYDDNVLLAVYGLHYANSKLDCGWIDRVEFRDRIEYIIL